MMKLTIVGCSGSLSGPDSAASSYLVQAPHQDRTFSLLLDIGPGAMGALYRYLDPRELDAIAASPSTSISTGIPGSPASGSGPLRYGPSMLTIR